MLLSVQQMILRRAIFRLLRDCLLGRIIRPTSSQYGDWSLVSCPRLRCTIHTILILRRAVSSPVPLSLVAY